MKIPLFSISVFTSIGLAAAICAAQPVQTQPSAPDTSGRPLDRVQLAPETKNPLVVRIDPARVLDSSGQAIGKVENIVLTPAGCAEAAIITGERGRMIPVPWQSVKITGETRGQGEAPGSSLTFTVNANNEKILAAPSFARNEWPNVTSVSWLQPSVQYFRNESATGGTTESSGTVSGAGASSNIGSTNSTSVTGPGATLPPTGRPGVPNLPPVAPSIPEPVNPGSPSVIPPRPPLPPPPATQPPATVPPDNFPRPVNPPAIP